MRRARGDDGFQPLVAADSVLHMDHQVLRREVRGIGDEVPGAAPARPGQALAQNVLLADDEEIGGLETLFDAEHGERGGALRQSLDLRPARRRGEAGDAVLGEDLAEPFARARRPGRDDDPDAVAAARVQRPLHPVERVARLAIRLRRGAGKGGRAAAGEIGDRIEGSVRHVPGRAVRLEIAQLAPRQQAVPLGRVEIEPAGRQRPVGRRAVGPRASVFQVGPPGIVVVGDHFEPGVARRLDLVFEGHHRIGQVVEQGLQPVMEQRQPVLHADLLSPLAHRLVERVVGYRAEGFAIAGAEAADGGRVQRDLAYRGQREPLQRGRGPLGSGVEAADPLQRVAEQIEADRLVGAGREDVDDPAADRELAGLAHRARALVAVAHQKPGEPVEVETVSRRGLEGGAEPDRARRQALQRGRDGGEHDHRAVRLPVGEAGHGVHPLGDDLAHRRDPVIGQAIPGGQPQDPEIRREEADSLGEPGKPGIVARDVQHARPAARGEFRDDPCFQRLRHAGEQRPSGPRGGVDPVRPGGGRAHSAPL